MFRHSCGVCYYTNLHRPSDITLADFWGWENNVPGMNDDDKGVSLVLINTEKGRSIFEKSSKQLEIKEVDVINSLQPNLQRPTQIHPKRKEFEKDYCRKGFIYITKKYDDIGFLNRFQNKLNRFKKTIKELLLSNNRM